MAASAHARFDVVDDQRLPPGRERLLVGGDLGAILLHAHDLWAQRQIRNVSLTIDGDVRLEPVHVEAIFAAMSEQRAAAVA